MRKKREKNPKKKKKKKKKKKTFFFFSLFVSLAWSRQSSHSCSSLNISERPQRAAKKNLSSSPTEKKNSKGKKMMTEKKLFFSLSLALSLFDARTRRHLCADCARQSCAGASLASTEDETSLVPFC
jgi:hypothetical protein